MNELKLRGHVRVRAWRRGRFLWEIDRDNLVVTAGMTPASKLLGGDVTNQSVTAIGAGAGTAAVTVGDTQLTAPAYYKALTSHSYPAAGQVQFNWTLAGGTDTGAIGININELGLFCNTSAIALPVYEASAAPGMTLFAHLLLGLGAFSSGLNFSGSWTITVG